MLTRDDNDILTRVGPGTPMGNLMRHYWLPAAMTTELPEPDCAPLRLRLLGEDLVAWRNTDGSVGVMLPACCSDTTLSRRTARLLPCCRISPHGRNA